MKLISSLTIFFFAPLLILCGCTPKHQKSTATLSQKVVLSNTLVITPTKTTTQTPINTILPTQNPTSQKNNISTIESSPTRTTIPTTDPIPTRTVIPTIEPTPSWTALPTLSPEKKNEFVLDLLLHNSGCALPCFWGIMPGKTTWDEARQFLRTFATKIGDGIQIPVKIDGKNTPVTGFTIKYQIPGLSSDGGVNFFITKGPIYKIIVYPIGTDISFTLSQLLTDYSEPDGIWVQGWPYNDERVPHYALLITYNEGILARYEGIATITGGKMRICPQQSGPGLVLWDAQKERLDFVEILIEGENDRWGAPMFEPLQKATEMDIASFYQLMQDPNACLETPLNLWDDRDFGIMATLTPGK